MTAEVAILNKYGVALAADSAVTIGGRKIYNSANKLFALTKHHPVGIMIYGAAQINGVPWETLIKFYRSRILLGKKFDTIEEYRDNFLDFLKRTTSITSESEDRFIRYFIQTACLNLVKAIERRAKFQIEKNGRITKRQTNTIVKEVLEQWCSTHIASCTVDPAEKKQLFEKYRPVCDEKINDIFENLPITKVARAKLVEAIVCALANDVPVTDGSGIVISGFGEKEMFPTLSRFTVEGRLNGHLKITTQSVEAVTDDNSAIIVPFAQREMVSMFMEGIDPKYRVAVSHAVADMLKQIPELLKTKHSVSMPAATRDAVNNDIDQILTKFEEGLEAVQMNAFVRPVLDSVAALPLDELALMADALVNLTSFKRRVTMVLESVGGPIDTAVISKGDGFIWIKRKHYFEPELNPHFFGNSIHGANHDD